MQELKRSSSVWIHEQIGLTSFAWQEGYSAFSVSPTSRAKVQNYIKNQQSHHFRRTHNEELIEMLDKAGIEYDPKYLD